MGEWGEVWLIGDGHDAYGIRGLAAAVVHSWRHQGRRGSRRRRWWWRLSGLVVWVVWVVVVVVAMSRLRMGGSVHHNVPPLSVSLPRLPSPPSHLKESNQTRLYLTPFFPLRFLSPFLQCFPLIQILLKFGNTTPQLEWSAGPAVMVSPTISGRCSKELFRFCSD